MIVISKFGVLRSSCTYNMIYKTTVTLALIGADGGAMVSRGVRWTSHTEVLTTLRLVETTRTLHAFTSISGKVLACHARL